MLSCIWRPYEIGKSYHSYFIHIKLRQWQLNNSFKIMKSIHSFFLRKIFEPRQCGLVLLSIMFYCSFIEECLKFRYNDLFSTIFQSPSYISKCIFLNNFLRRVNVLQLNWFPFLMTSSHNCNNKPNCGWNYRWLIQVKMSSGEKEDVADYILRNNNSVFSSRLS